MAKDKNIPKSEVIQINRIYQSTVDFNKFLLENNILSNNKKTKVLDVGIGIGSNLKYLANQFKYSEFVRIDYAKKLNENKRISFYCADMLKKNNLISKLNSYDLSINIHTICCFKNLEKLIKFLCDFKTKWIAINSLSFMMAQSMLKFI